jgi:hypothetical protein
MIDKQRLLKKIEKLPPYLLEEIDNYVNYIEFKRTKGSISKIGDITLASEKSLSKDWLKPEEDDAWEDL